MNQKFLAFVFMLRRSLLLRLQRAYLTTHTKCESAPKINNGAVIGAQSLVNCEIPANAIAVGTPARVIGYRK